MDRKQFIRNFFSTILGFSFPGAKRPQALILFAPVDHMLGRFPQQTHTSDRCSSKGCTGSSTPPVSSLIFSVGAVAAPHGLDKTGAVLRSCPGIPHMLAVKVFVSNFPTRWYMASCRAERAFNGPSRFSKETNCFPGIPAHQHTLAVLTSLGPSPAAGARLHPLAWANFQPGSCRWHPALPGTSRRAALKLLGLFQHAGLVLGPPAQSPLGWGRSWGQHQAVVIPMNHDDSTDHPVETPQEVWWGWRSLFSRSVKVISKALQLKPSPK